MPWDKYKVGFFSEDKFIVKNYIRLPSGYGREVSHLHFMAGLFLNMLKPA